MFNENPRDPATLISQGYTFQPTQYIGQGWEILKPILGLMIGFTVVSIIINIGLGFIPRAGSLLSVVIAGPLNAGFFIVAFRHIRRQSTDFARFFDGFQNFLPLFLANLLVTIFTAIGTLLLILPGIYLGVSYLFALPLVVDRNLDFWEAMETSRQVVGKNWFGVFIFGLLLVLINVAGALLLGVGLLFTIPLTTCAVVAAYRDIFGLRTA
ncbi:MAG: glycerophosphoryl diester phosphodiesterase membrane domain-containing protein [Cyanobacteriota bacterium]|nr:glycerophosphoryl diester phosphodiesterase membrane domain-containing protein [Cyanobacteriota bacterium]